MHMECQNIDFGMNVSPSLPMSSTQKEPVTSISTTNALQHSTTISSTYDPEVHNMHQMSIPSEKAKRDLKILIITCAVAVLTICMVIALGIAITYACNNLCTKRSRSSEKLMPPHFENGYEEPIKSN